MELSKEQTESNLELSKDQSISAVARYNVGKRTDLLSPWYNGSTLPEKIGWYLVEHWNETYSWIVKDGVFCYFNGKDFVRPYGWKTRTDSIKCMVLNDDGRLIMPPVSFKYITEVVCKKVIVIRWCGVNVEIESI